MKITETGEPWLASLFLIIYSSFTHEFTNLQYTYQGTVFKLELLTNMNYNELEDLTLKG